MDDNKRKGYKGNWNEEWKGRKKRRVYKGRRKRDTKRVPAGRRRAAREKQRVWRGLRREKKREKRAILDGKAFGVAGSGGINRSEGKLFGR